MKKFLKWPVLALVVLLFAFRSNLIKSSKGPFEEPSTASILHSPSLRPCEASCATSFKESWSDSLIKTLTLDEKIGQLFMVAAWSDEKKES
ncbi:MAG: hypothetical protein RI989_594, partial [Bacteroidota bacterium]